MTNNPQTEARAIWHDALNCWMKASRHGTKVNADDIAVEIIATALAAKDAELAVQREAKEHARRLCDRAEAQLAEARKALEEIERRTARSPDDTPGDDKRDKFHANAIARRAQTGGKKDG